MSPVDYAYDEFGDKISMATYRNAGVPGFVPAAGDTTRWLRDEATGLVTNKVYADGKGPRYDYTPDGRLATRTWARGIVTAYSYDDNGALTNTVYSDGTPTISIVYNRAGRQIEAHDAAGITTFLYDDFGSLTNETVIGVAGTNTIERFYDGFGRSLGYSLNGVRQSTLAYDPATGRLASMQIPPEQSNNPNNQTIKQFSWNYLAGSDLKSSLDYPDGLTASWAYDANGQLLQVKNAFPTNTISQYDYVYDAAGRRINVAKSGTAFNHDDTIAYGYNARSELTNAVAAVDSDYRYSYDFDDIGNREFSSERGTNSVYTANKLNQYTAVDDFTPQFDADGNQTLIKTATGIWQVSYNGENRPIHWSNGLTNIVMSFDRMGRRVTKNAQRFVYDGYLQIANFEHSTSNIELQTFIWDPTEPVATRPLVWNRSGTSSFYTHDGNKNVSEAVSENGQIAAHYECEPFGAVSSQYGESASSNPWRFSCEYAEDDTALVYYNSRHYESICGRWISRDLIEESGGVNLYSFCVNAAILRQDRLGFSWVISRKGEIYAEACADSLNDDFESLAEVLSLNDYEYQKWAQTNDMLPKRGKIYKIPNVMVMYASKPQWVKDGVLSLAYRLRRKVREEADAYENEGFYVKRYWLYDSEEEFISAWCLPGIYAISIAGHGTVYGYKAEPSSDSAVSPHEVSILYHLASVHAYFCYSADDIVDPNGKVMSWRYLVSHNGSFLGYLGVGWHWSDQFTDDNHLDD